MHLGFMLLCGWICELVSFTRTKFDPFFELLNFIKKCLHIMVYNFPCIKLHYLATFWHTKSNLTTNSSYLLQHFCWYIKCGTFSQIWSHTYSDWYPSCNHFVNALKCIIMEKQIIIIIITSKQDILISMQYNTLIQFFFQVPLDKIYMVLFALQYYNITVQRLKLLLSLDHHIVMKLLNIQQYIYDITECYHHHNEYYTKKKQLIRNCAHSSL